MHSWGRIRTRHLKIRCEEILFCAPVPDRDAGRTRTNDRHLIRVVLYQLSYRTKARLDNDRGQGVDTDVCALTH